ncbi:MAG: hypothetical protein GY820_31330 [Gammaproteobacteria bacterium]|nr:hypothetical protein [Gammaproteobacteria bacterium]
MNNKNENIDDFVSQLRGLSARSWPHSRRADREKAVAEQLLNSLPKNLHDSVMLSGNWSLNELLVVLRGIEQHDQMIGDQMKTRSNVSQPQPLRNEARQPTMYPNSDRNFNRGQGHMRNVQNYVENTMNNPPRNVQYETPVKTPISTPPTESLPTFEILVEGRPYKVVFDSGADTGLVVPVSKAHDVLGHVHSKELIDFMCASNSDQFLMNFNGKVVNICGETNVQVSYKGKKIVTPMMFAENMPKNDPFIMGCKSLNALGIRILDHTGTNLLSRGAQQTDPNAKILSVRVCRTTANGGGQLCEGENQMSALLNKSAPSPNAHSSTMDNSRVKFCKPEAAETPNMAKNDSNFMFGPRVWYNSKFCRNTGQMFQNVSENGISIQQSMRPFGPPLGNASRYCSKRPQLNS